MKNTKEMGLTTQKRSNRRGTKTAFQFWWEDELRQSFTELVNDYDVDLDMTTAIIKVVRNAVKDWYIPGYERKEKGRTLNRGAVTGTARDVDDLAKGFEQTKALKSLRKSDTL